MYDLYCLKNKANDCVIFKNYKAIVCTTSKTSSSVCKPERPAPIENEIYVVSNFIAIKTMQQFLQTDKYR